MESAPKYHDSIESGEKQSVVVAHQTQTCFKALQQSCSQILPHHHHQMSTFSSLSKVIQESVQSFSAVRSCCRECCIKVRGNKESVEQTV